MPASHTVHTETAMAAENVPAWQERQVSAAMAPLAAENLPAPQLVHVSTLVSAEYVPTGQSVQTEAPAADVSAWSAVWSGFFHT